MPADTLTLDGVTLRVVIERKRVKHVNARLAGDTLRVSAPVGIPEATLDASVADLARRLLKRVRARQVNAEEDAVELARKVARRFPRKPKVERVHFVTTQRARWGSYSRASRTIRLNAVLRHMPRWVLEAVVAHELAHAFHRGHGEAFWELLRRVCPDTDRANAFLAGVTWLSGRWPELPPVERAQLESVAGDFTRPPRSAPSRRTPRAADEVPPLEAWLARSQGDDAASGG
ncbi:MAG: YgjP-like metallopeptidase domain-containing protein [Acidobacteriota bacterium]